MNMNQGKSLCGGSDGGSYRNITGRMGVTLTATGNGCCAWSCVYGTPTTIISERTYMFVPFGLLVVDKRCHSCSDAGFKCQGRRKQWGFESLCRTAMSLHI